MNKNNRFRIVMTLLGCIAIGMGIGTLRMADLGTDPFTTLLLGVSYFFNIAFGHVSLVVNAIGILIMILFGRKFIGIGTFFNMILVGYIADFTFNGLASLIQQPSFMMRLLIGLIGLLIVIVGASLYIATQRGVAPYDALPLIIEERSKGTISFRNIRVFSDVTSVVLGYLLSATVGIMTVIASFLVGPLIQYLRRVFTDFLLKMESKTSHS